MRTKAQILDDSLRAQSKTPNWDTTASLHEALTIEVLIDIRNVLVELHGTQKYFLKQMAGKD